MARRRDRQALRRRRQRREGADGRHPAGVRGSDRRRVPRRGRVVPRRGTASDARPAAARLRVRADGRAAALPRGHGFTCFIASGGSRDFMRAITARSTAIPPERVVGSSNGLQYTDDEHGGSLAYLAEPDVFDDGPVKPVRIWSRIGRRPLLAGGNSNGDIPMLRFAGGRSGRRCASSSCTTTPSGSSTTSRAPSGRSSGPRRTAWTWAGGPPGGGGPPPPIVAVGIFLGLVFEAPVRFVERHTPLGRGMSATVTVIGILVAVTLLALAFLKPLLEGLQSFLKDLTGDRRAAAQFGRARLRRRYGRRRQRPVGSAERLGCGAGRARSARRVRRVDRVRGSLRVPDHLHLPVLPLRGGRSQALARERSAEAAGRGLAAPSGIASRRWSRGGRSVSW